MKNIFTYGIFLFFLLWIGNNVSASLIKSAGTGIAGLDWSNTLAWAGGVVPTTTDSVQIVAGDSITTLLGNASCQTITVNGKLMVKSSSLWVNGNVTINSGGVFNLDKYLYCKNVYNYGKFWASGRTNSGSSTVLYLGYNSTGTTATASTDSCTIVNDGIFGWYRAASMSGSNGCGLLVYYANTAKAVNITHSPNASGYVFTVNAIMPTNAGTQSQNFNLYINESVATAQTGSAYPFSLHANETFPNTFKRTCTIAAGDTVFVAGYFHRNSAPGVVQGQMIYNIYGCLDMASVRQTKNEFDIYTSATNSSPVTINIGDGTLANAGTLVFGGTINISAGAANQIIFNPTKYSTVKFNYKAAPAITLTGFSLSAYNLYVNSFGVPVTIGAIPVAGDLTMAGAINNTVTLNGSVAQTITGGSQTVTGLTINNPLGASLASALNVSGALTMTAGNLVLGSSNLTVGSISGASSSNYVVTNGAGTFTQTAAAAGTLFPIGTATGYAPVTITPASDDIISANVSATTAVISNSNVNHDEWTLTPATATTATLAFTPEVATFTAIPVIFSGSGYTTTSVATLSGSTYSASGISLAASANPFATGSTLATALVSNTSSNLLIYTTNKSLVVRNAKMGDMITVYGITGLKVASSIVNNDNTTMTLMNGIYLVKVGDKTTKVVID